MPKTQRAKHAPSRGTLKVFDNRMHELGRAVRCARLLSVGDGLDTDILPEILDAEMIWLDGAAIRIRGIERVDGAFYAQTWEITVL